ncbi:MAG TPA: hypothetical protein VLM75_09595 [Spirochaetota bacterium]|nr:hypothetical protein [Spirochaetota bacterium]
MRKSLSRGSKPGGEGKKASWKRRPSEIRGYQAALYTTTDGGDYLRVDYNLKDRKIRIYMEDAEEGGNPYYAVFSGGRVSAQRNVTTGRAHQVVEKLKLRGDSLRTISNKEVRRIVTVALKLEDAPPAEKSERTETRKEVLARTRKRYFRTDETLPGASAAGGAMTMGAFFRGLLDYVVGILLTVAVFLYYHSFIAAGVAAAFFGVFVGIIEIFLRGRDPSVIKMLFFVGAGAALYVYGYYFL